MFIVDLHNIVMLLSPTCNDVIGICIVLASSVYSPIVVLCMHCNAVLNTLKSMCNVAHCRPGMQADFTVLDGNLLDVLHRGLNELPTVKATYVKGQLQYDSAQAPFDLSGKA